jgi:hypothetical protein
MRPRKTDACSRPLSRSRLQADTLVTRKLSDRIAVWDWPTARTQSRHFPQKNWDWPTARTWSRHSLEPNCVVHACLLSVLAFVAGPQGTHLSTLRLLESRMMTEPKGPRRIGRARACQPGSLSVSPASQFACHSRECNKRRRGSLPRRYGLKYMHAAEFTNISGLWPHAHSLTGSLGLTLAYDWTSILHDC